MSKSFEDYKVQTTESKGALSTDTNYELVITSIEFQPDVVTHRNAPEHVRGKMLDMLTPEDRANIGVNWTSNILRITFLELESGISIRKNFNITKLNVNEENKRFQSEFVTFLKSLGYDIKPQQDILPAQYIKKDMRIIAKVKDQIDKKTGKTTGFHELDIESARLKQPPANTTQAKISEVPEDKKKELMCIMGNSGTLSDAIRKLSSTGRMDLLDVLTTLQKSGEIKF